MAAREDPRLFEAQAIPIAEVAEKLGIAGLTRTGSEMIGPCPVCGGKDRFGINTRMNVFNCRRECGGGDGIKLVQLVMGLDFKAALAWLVGDASAEIDPREVERRRRKAEEDRRRQEAFAEKKRRESIAAARRIWAEGRPAERTIVRGYLARRGFPEMVLGTMPPALRYHPALPFMERGRPSSWVEVHRGPAMLAGILSPAGEIIGVHRTWIDLTQPHGKAVIRHNGKELPAKKVLGSKKGGAIRLVEPEGARCLIMGEGIETTLTAAVADGYPGAAYWAGIDLGNMAGRRITRGQGMKYAGVPDLDDPDAFLPPPWARHLIFIQDGDSEPRSTRAKLLAGLRRARARVRGVERISIVHAGEGRDLNDILTEDEEE